MCCGNITKQKAWGLSRCRAEYVLVCKTGNHQETVYQQERILQAPFITAGVRPCSHTTEEERRGIKWNHIVTDLHWIHSVGVVQCENQNQVEVEWWQQQCSSARNVSWCDGIGHDGDMGQHCGNTVGLMGNCGLDTSGGEDGRSWKKILQGSSRRPQRTG